MIVSGLLFWKDATNILWHFLSLEHPKGFLIFFISSSEFCIDPPEQEADILLLLGGPTDNFIFVFFFKPLIFKIIL